MSLLARLFGWSSVPSIDPAQAQARLAVEPQPFLLDVRELEEYQAAHIPGTCLIPLKELPRRLGELPRDCEIICICQSGRRGRSATQQLRAAGYNAVNLEGGTIRWSRQGLPVQKGSSR